ncbi:hypothetical protein TNCT_269051 [Trichonephila clavata]|uniref:Uncharacterized protein n=1 Tax=Trichonephila clavata TaxID=2740835 RepID=A0A8X6JNG1_TRICU|nr:hypothetical protein TNCT_269051 [Trichonephila clavata]
MAENMLSHALCLHASSDAKVVGGYRAKRSGRSSRSPSLEHVGENWFARDFNKRNIQIHLCLLTLSMPIIVSNTCGAYVASCVSERWNEFDAYKSRVNWVRPSGISGAIENRGKLKFLLVCGKGLLIFSMPIMVCNIW